MSRSNDATLPIDMTPAVACAPAPHGYPRSRSAATRPMLCLAAMRGARHARSVQLGWVGLVRR